MNKRFLVTRFYLILLVLFFISCDDTELDPNSIFNQDGKFRYNTKKVFCQNEPNREISSRTFTYDNNGNKTEEVSYNWEEPGFKIISRYNSNNQKLTDSFFYYANNSWVLSNSNLYKYSKGRLTEMINYDTGETLLHKTAYKYSNSKLKYEEIYRREDGDWVLNFAYGYEYNRYGQLVKKLSYHDEAKDKVYDQYIYTYKNGKLDTEKRILITGEIQFLKEYLYTEDGLLDEVVEDGNTIQKNYYRNGNLIEKHTWYFSIDPYFSPCSGNCIYKYEY